jgi:hypothetical protein
MHAYFHNGELQLNVADMNVYVNYYPFDDDSLMIGMNHLETSQLKMYMKNRKVDKMWAPASNGVMYPLILIPPGELYLENFAWFDYIRPLDKDDIFRWRGKKAGTELKASVQRAAPKQKLSDLKEGKTQVATE